MGEKKQGHEREQAEVELDYRMLEKIKAACLSSDAL
jgi:hypothetical protein